MRPERNTAGHNGHVAVLSLPHAAGARLPPDGQVFVRSCDPLDFLRAHHRVQLGICSALSLIADDLHHDRVAERAQTVLKYLIYELPLHQAHETVDLPEALELSRGVRDAQALFDPVAANHRYDRGLVERVFEGLLSLAGEDLPPAPMSFVVTLLQLAESLRRHIEWEDRMILPFAATTLSPTGRAALIGTMAARYEPHNEYLAAEVEHLNL